jgi:hypothetical protein
MDLVQFDLIWSGGHSMTMEQAIEFALQDNNE